MSRATAFNEARSVDDLDHVPGNRWALWPAATAISLLIALPSCSTREGADKQMKRMPDAAGAEASLPISPPPAARTLPYATSQTQHGAGCSGSRKNDLLVTEVQYDEEWLYLGVQHTAVVNASIPARRVEAVVRANGRLLGPIAMSGTIRYGGNAPVWMAMEYARLPDGELDILVRAFGAEHTLTLVKSGTDLGPLPLRGRSGVILGDGEIGIPANSDDIRAVTR